MSFYKNISQLEYFKITYFQSWFKVFMNCRNEIAM